MTWLVLPAVGGGLIGALYFGGLWATVQRLPHARWPAALTLASFVVRTGLAALGFVALLAGEPVRLGVALVAFVVVRALFVRRARPEPVLGAGDAR